MNELNEVISSYAIECKGTVHTEPLSGFSARLSTIFIFNLSSESLIPVSITVYKDGSRDIGCPYLGAGGYSLGRCTKLSKGKEILEPFCPYLKTFKQTV